jgi:hypothetical protein
MGHIKAETFQFETGTSPLGFIIKAERIKKVNKDIILLPIGYDYTGGYVKERHILDIPENHRICRIGREGKIDKISDFQGKAQGKIQVGIGKPLKIKIKPGTQVQRKRETAIPERSLIERFTVTKGEIPRFKAWLPGV